jgi:hypothetical protein
VIRGGKERRESNKALSKALPLLLAL